MACMRISLLGLLYGTITTMIQAQAPDIVWQRCLGGTQGEDSWAVQVAADGGFAVLGTTESNDGDVSGNHGLHDYWLAKLDNAGNLLWQRCYGGMFQETANGLLATSDGGYLLLGDADSMEGDVACGGPPQSWPWAVKVDSTGEIQWQACLWGEPGSGMSWIRAVETEDGAYMILGGSSADVGVWHENHGQGDFFVAKLDGTGQIQWLHCYGGSGREDGFVIRASPDGNYVVAGTTGSSDGQVTTGSIGQVWVIKIDPEGNLLWNRRMGGSNGPGLGQEVRDLVVNPDGSILVVGTVGANDGDISGNHGSYDVWLVLLDSSGTIMQQRCFGGSGWDTAWGGAAANQGRYVIAGYTQSNDGDVSGNHGGTGQDAWVFMVDSALNLVWQKCLGGTASDQTYAMARSPNGETIISGSTGSNDGDVSGYHGNGDIWVAKLAPDLDAGVSRQGTKDLQVFPNPASNLVNVRFSGAVNANTALDIVDVTGRVVLHRKLDLGIRSMQVPVDGWASGLYGIRLNMGNATRTLRFVKQ